MHKAIPCCVARRSVSTCGGRQAALNEPPVFIRLGSHSHECSLTRQAKSIVFGLWQRQRLSAATAAGKPNAQGTVRRDAPSAGANITSKSARRGGTGPTSRRGTTKKARRTTTGEVVPHHTTTRRLPTLHMETNVFYVVSPPSLFTTRTTIDLTVIPPIYNPCASVATKSRCITAPRTCPTLRRYSQRPRKLGTYVLNYGEGPAKLARTLGITIEEAKLLKEKYFVPYPGVREFIDCTHAMIRETCQVETILGRPRRFPEMEHLGQMRYWDMRGSEKMINAQCERQSVNSIIQGSAADVAKMAMILCDGDSDIKNLGAQLLLQIHDELIFEVPEETVEEVIPLVKERMEHPFDQDLLVPLAVDSGIGYSWASAKA